MALGWSRSTIMLRRENYTSDYMEVLDKIIGYLNTWGGLVNNKDVPQCEILKGQKVIRKINCYIFHEANRYS